MVLIFSTTDRTNLIGTDFPDHGPDQVIWSGKSVPRTGPKKIRTENQYHGPDRTNYGPAVRTSLVKSGDLKNGKSFQPVGRDTNQYIDKQYIDIGNININMGFCL